jgi:hypothetical protein
MVPLALAITEHTSTHSANVALVLWTVVYFAVVLTLFVLVVRWAKRSRR